MEAAATSTGSKTIADLIPRAAGEYGERVAIRYKRDGSGTTSATRSSPRSCRRSASG